MGFHLLCAVPHKQVECALARYAPLRAVPLAGQRRSLMQGRITELAHSERRNAMRRSSSFHDAAGSGSDRAQHAIARAFISRSMSA